MHYLLKSTYLMQKAPQDLLMLMPLTNTHRQTDGHTVGGTRQGYGCEIIDDVIKLSILLHIFMHDWHTVTNNNLKKAKDRDAELGESSHKNPKTAMHKNASTTILE